MARVGDIDMGGLDLSFFSWEIISKFVQKGFIFSIELTAVATVGGILLGTVLALMRLSGVKLLMWPATVYVNVMRSIPLVMVILWFFLLVPSSFYSYLPQGANYRSEYSAAITFIAFEAAYFSEIMRAGIQSIPRGQVHAGQAVGMTYAQNMRLVILPQAFRNMLPVIFTQTIVLFQDTSLVYVLSITDFLGAASKVAQRDGRLTEMYLFAAVVYFVICFTASFFVKRLQKRISIIR